MTCKNPVTGDNVTSNSLTGNPFKRLFRTADVCGVLRILAAVGAILYWENGVAGIMAFILVSALTDLSVLRPLFKKTFLTKSFTEAHVNWLKEKQDISPENLMVFFRKILTFRATSLSLAAVSIPLLWMVKGQEIAFVAAPFVYVATFFILFAFFQHKAIAVFPKKYRPSLDMPERKHSFSYEPYNPSRNAIRHWDITDVRGSAYRRNRWDYGGKMM